jgi:hypothetical protein
MAFAAFSSTSKRFLILVAVLILLFCCGCGGGGGSSGGGGGGGNPVPTITSVTVSCSPASVQTGQTSQCTANVQGTGSFNSAVTWAVSPASAGTVSAAGVFSASTSTGTATITATSAQDSTKSGSATVTVTPPPATIASVAVSCSPGTIQTGQTSQCSALVSGTGNFTSAVTWSVSPASAGTVNASGLFTASASAGTATITATSVQDTTKSGSATVTATLPPAPTVTLAASPTTITLGQSTTLTIQATNATSCTISGAASGSVPCNGSISETPSATGTATYTVTATGPGGTTTSSPVSVTVNPAPPVITSISPTHIYLDRDLIQINAVKMLGSGFIAGGCVVLTPTAAVAYATFVSSSEIDFGLVFDTQHWSPGMFTIAYATDCQAAPDSNSVNLAFLGNQNTLAVGPAGLFQLDQAQGAPAGQDGYVREFDLSGNAVWNFLAGALINGISFDDGTGEVIVGGAGYNPGSSTPVSYPTNDGNGMVMGVAAENKITCVTRPDTNLVSCYDLTQLLSPLISAPAGNQPWSLAMADMTVNSAVETDAFVY